MAAVLDQLRDAWDRTDDRQAMSVVGRAGVGTRGVMYLMVAGLAVKIALGDPASQPDSQGVLQVLVRQPMGRLLVAFLALGLVLFALWNLGHAVLAPADDDRLWRRIRNGFRGVLYLGLSATTVPFVLGRSQSGNGDAAKDMTVTVLGWPGGRWLVGAVAAGIVVDGVAQAVKAFDGRHRRETEPDSPGWVDAVGAAARVSRAGIFVLVGVFLGRVALRFDSAAAVGVDGALLELTRRPYGPALLLVAAAAIATFGVYSLLRVRYGRVVDGDSA